MIGKTVKTSEGIGVVVGKETYTRIKLVRYLVEINGVKRAFGIWEIDLVK